MTLLIPKHQYSRTTALVTMAEAGTGILAPVLAAFLIGFVGIAPIFD
ncbi:MAG: hypothetical protein QMD88_05360 [Coprothermobacterota bacterium]|nr:hypothetical protein [Coprothermobacterota bacterium]